MDVREVVARARESMTAKQVFGKPYEKNGLTVLTVRAIVKAGRRFGWPSGPREDVVPRAPRALGSPRWGGSGERAG